MRERRGFPLGLIVVLILAVGCADEPMPEAAPATSAESAPAKPAPDARAAHPRGVLLYLQQAREAEQAEDLDRALESYQKALQLAPRHPSLWFSAASLHARMGDWPTAIGLLEKVAALGGAYDLDARGPFGDRPVDERSDAVAAHLRANAAAAPKAELVAVLDNRELWPEGIAHDPVDGALYLGSMHGVVTRVDRNGRQTELASAELPELLGMDVDPVRRRLWVVAGDGPMDPASEQLRTNSILQFELPGGAPAGAFPAVDPQRNLFLNDLAVAPDGSVYVTDSNHGRLYRRAPDESLKLFMELEEANFLNGIAVSDDGRRLYTTHLEGLTWVDLETRESGRMAVAGDFFLGHGDGLVYVDHSLVVVQNMPFLNNRLARFHLDADGTRATGIELLVSGLPEGLIPYTAAAGDGVLYFNGTAEYQLRDRGETPPHPVIAKASLG